jgi:hypothetical protein
MVNGKVTYVHRRLWPALVVLARRFSKQNLAAIKEVHTATGRHKLLVTPFPDWLPKQVLRAAHDIKEQEAASQLAAVLKAKNQQRANKSVERTAAPLLRSTLVPIRSACALYRSWRGSLTYHAERRRLRRVFMFYLPLNTPKASLWQSLK